MHISAMDLREGRSVCFQTSAHPRDRSAPHSRPLHRTGGSTTPDGWWNLLWRPTEMATHAGRTAATKGAELLVNAPVMTGFQQRRSEEIAVPGEKILLHILLCIAGQQKRYVAVLQLDHHDELLRFGVACDVSASTNPAPGAMTYHRLPCPPSVSSPVWRRRVSSRWPPRRGGTRHIPARGSAGRQKRPVPTAKCLITEGTPPM